MMMVTIKKFINQNAGVNHLPLRKLIWQHYHQKAKFILQVVISFFHQKATFIIFQMVQQSFWSPDGSYAVEKILDDTNDVTGLRFTEVELSGNDYVTVQDGHVSEVGVHDDDALYQMKHYP